MAGNVLPVNDFGARSVSCSETSSKNGVAAKMMLDSSMACAVQPASLMSTNESEICCACPNESQEVIELKQNSSISTSTQPGECLDASKNECALNLIACDPQTEDGKSGEKVRRRYTRRALEVLKLVDVDEQREKWDAIYKGLGSIISREYDEILGGSQPKPNQNSERRQRHEKKKEISTTKRESSVENVGEVSCAQEICSLVCSNSVEESWTAEEEQCEDSESDDEYSSIQRPAFYVEGEPDFESGPPQDGWEYLRRVRWEAAQMPKVKVVELDKSKFGAEQTPYMPKIPEIARCPESLSPSKHWVDNFLAEFSELRKAFSELENSANRASHRPSDGNTCEGSPGLRRNLPTLSAILEMDCVCRAATLRTRIEAFESSGTVSRENCLWLFALCVAVDTPLDAEMGSCLRCLLRKCSTLLAQKSEFDEEVAMLQVLIVISGKYFGQSES